MRSKTLIYGYSVTNDALSKTRPKFVSCLILDISDIQQTIRGYLADKGSVCHICQVFIRFMRISNIKHQNNTSQMSVEYLINVCRMSADCLSNI